VLKYFIDLLIKSIKYFNNEYKSQYENVEFSPLDIFLYSTFITYSDDNGDSQVL